MALTEDGRLGLQEKAQQAEEGTLEFESDDGKLFCLLLSPQSRQVSGSQPSLSQ